MRWAVLAIALIVTPAKADWTVTERIALPVSGETVDVAALATGEGPVRIVLVGSYFFALDGAEVDAFGAHTPGERDVSAGALVTLPPGSRVVASDPTAHRYEIEVPRAPSMPVAFNVAPLAMRHLITVSEARASLRGAIELEVVVPPPPAPPAAAMVARRASSSPFPWMGGALGVSTLGGIGLLLARRRRARVLLRRAHRAERSIARECAVLGPAFDPVAASARRLLESAERSTTHRREVERALARTRWAESAAAERAHLRGQAEGARRKLVEIVARLEQTATQLAGRRAESAKDTAVEALLDELSDDLEAAVSAEEDVTRLAPS